MKVLAVLFLSMGLVGCSMSFTPTKKYLFHPKPLVQAERAVEQARAIGKDKQCPAEFNSTQDLVDKAYQTYWDCKDDESIQMAKEASLRAAALCPPPTTPAPIAEIKPEAKPEAPTPLPPAPAPPATEEPKKSEVKIELPPAPRPTILLEDIHFEFDKSSLTEEAKKILEKNIQALKENPELKVRAEGHACSHGTDEYNMALSERRVKETTEYLIKNGIAAGRLSGIALGETEPLLFPIPENPMPYNKNSEAMKANRRVHFEIVR